MLRLYVSEVRGKYGDSMKSVGQMRSKKVERSNPIKVTSIGKDGGNRHQSFISYKFQVGRSVISVY